MSTILTSESSTKYCFGGFSGSPLPSIANAVACQAAHKRLINHYASQTNGRFDDLAYLHKEACLGLASELAIRPPIVAEGNALYEVLDTEDVEHSEGMSLVRVREAEDARLAWVERRQELAKRRVGREDILEWEGGITDSIVVEGV